jgi:flagellin
MSLTNINTNINALTATASLNKLGFEMSRTLTRLSTGLRLNTAADDPSGIGQSASFRAQLSGVKQASQNAQDALSLMSLADTALTDTMDVLIRMRDLAVKAATDATLTTGQRQTMEQEYISLKSEITRKQGSITFNGKLLFSGGLSGGRIQIGPDNVAAMRMSIFIPLISQSYIKGRDITVAHVSTANAAGSAIDYIQSAINGLASVQVSIGVQERQIERMITTLQSEEVNMSAALSRIQDADMASEVSDFARQQIIANSASAMIAQANAQPAKLMQLLGLG